MGTTSRRTISALIAALCLVAAAFAIPAAAKGGKGKGGGHGKGKGKKATIQSWDETTHTLVLTNKKGYEQTFTVADDARLTKVVPCDDDEDGSNDDGMDDEGTHDDGIDDDGTESDDPGSDEPGDDEPVARATDGDDPADADDADDDADDDAEDDSEDKTCGNLDATTADLVTGYRVLNFKSEDGVIYKLKVKVPHTDPDPEDCDDPLTTEVVEECPVDDGTPEPVETPVEDPPVV